MKYLPACLMLIATPAMADCLITRDEDAAWRMMGPPVVTMVRDCAAQGLDFSAPLASGKVPFAKIIAVNLEPEAVAIMLQAGADPNTTDASGSTAFVDMLNFSMSERDDPAKLDILRLLGEAGADFSRTDNYDQSALSFAVGSGAPETVQVLLEYGADPNGVHAYGRTALFNTVFGRCSPEIGQMLIDAGARLDVMGADQIQRLFAEADKSCGDSDAGRDYIKRLRALQAG